MKRSCLVAFFSLATVAATAQPMPPGFSSYFLGLLTRTGAAAPTDGTLPALQKAHLANLTRMWEEGVLLGSGPIADQGDLRGVLILRGGDRAGLDARLAADPLIKAGQLKVDVRPWAGPSDIGLEYKKWSAANPGAADRMRTYQLGIMRPVSGATPMTAQEAREHMLNMNSMVKAGKLAAAGPVVAPGDIAGIFIFDASPAEADAMAATDPGVKAGKVTVERHPWIVAEGVLPKGFKVPLQ
jgi:uncharacterized protein YciI